MAGDDRLVGGIELGGTKSIAAVARGRAIIEMARIPTMAPGPTLDALSRQLASWQSMYGPMEAIGIGSFGPLALHPGQADYGRIAATPKEGWSGVDLVGHFARHFAVPIGFDTDVAGAALAEYRWGAAQGCSVAVYLTIGTGIGGGVVINGAPVHGLIHPELGHLRVRRQVGDAFAGLCPFHGDCLEGLASGPAIAARTGAAGPQIADDHPIWDSVGNELAEAMAMLMLALSPQRILIGGGVPQKREPLFARIRARTAELLGGYVAGVGVKELNDIILPPQLGDMAGPLGAVALAYRA